MVVLVLLVLRFPISGKPVPFTASPEVRSLVEGNSAFAVDLYRRLGSEPGNLFFSPHGISTCLAMTYAGARGQTEKELATALHFQLPPAAVDGAFGELARRMDRIQRWNRLSLSSANSLWLQQDYRFADDFLAQIRTAYRVEAQRVDFKQNPQEAEARVNRWAAEATHGKIQDALRAVHLSPSSRLVLGNAIHFKGTWKDRFEPGETSTRLFHVTTETSVPVPMMHRRAHFKTASEEHGDLLLLELPYSGDDLSMVILLPQVHEFLPAAERFSLGALEGLLSLEKLNRWLQKLNQSPGNETDVNLPRFRLRQRYNLVPTLKTAGLTSLFDWRADLSGMDGTTNLFVTEVTHEAFVEVNEAGTEAAGITLMHVATKSMTTRVTIDHPFMFLIRDRASGSILFLGRIVDPTK